VTAHALAYYSSRIGRVERIFFMRIFVALISDTTGPSEKDSRNPIQECDRPPGGRHGLRWTLRLRRKICVEDWRGKECSSIKLRFLSWKIDNGTPWTTRSLR
jgi:hypothetical protein